MSWTILNSLPNTVVSVQPLSTPLATALSGTPVEISATPVIILPTTSLSQFTIPTPTIVLRNSDLPPQENPSATRSNSIGSTISPWSSDLNASITQLVTSSQSPSPSSSLPPDTNSSLSAGAGAGIGIGVLILLLSSIGGITFFLWKRRRRRLLHAQAEMTEYREKPQLADTSVVHENTGLGAMIPIEDRHELEGSSTPQLSPKSPTELRAGPYSNRHELESRHE